MKNKFIACIVLFACILSANAQKSYEGTTIKDGWSVSIAGGVFQPTVGQNPLSDNRALGNVEVQKQFSPIFGVGINCMAGINANNANQKSNVFWHNAPKTFVDFSHLNASGLINMTNIIAGYQGRPKVVEVVVRGGIGWTYVYGDCYPHGVGNVAQENDRYNYLNTTFGVDVNFNLFQSKAWQINFKPAITYLIGNPTLSSCNNNGLNVNNSHLSLMVGATYKFKNTNRKHYMTINDKRYSEGKWQDINDRINAERSAKEGLLELIANQEKAIRELEEENAQLKDRLAKELSRGKE